MTIEDFRKKVKELSDELEKDGFFVHRVMIGRSDDTGEVFGVRIDYEDREGSKQMEEEYFE